MVYKGLEIHVEAKYLFNIKVLDLADMFDIPVVISFCSCDISRVYAHCGYHPFFVRRIDHASDWCLASTCSR